jgi:lipopolysaccharide biosynthesis regulator YciM
MYIIGELHRRLGNNDEAIKWFSRLIGSPDARRNQSLMNMTRDQFQLVKDLQKETGA